jgi:hypothetical protein
MDELPTGRGKRRTARATEDFFAGRADSRRLFRVVSRAIRALGDCTTRVSKSQIAFRRRRGFAWVWVPAFYLKRDTAPLVLTISLPYRDPSNRWKEIVEPYPQRFTHHLELHDVSDIDEEVTRWLRQAWLAAD